jgi:chromosome segregation ATPase
VSFVLSRFRYEQKLAQERDVGLRLKGENGILKKKASAFQKDLEDQKDEIKELFEKKKDLYQTIASLEKDIASLKKEIRERDETIGDKEKRIYDLKKKNQVRVRVKKPRFAVCREVRDKRIKVLSLE